MSKQQGFTLIELVTVIIILGILAAFAVPRFINLTSSARAATIDGLSGSIKAASALAHAAYIVKDGSGTAAAPTAITMDGATVSLTFGYPSATSTGIAAALQDVDSFQHASGKFWLKGDGAAAPADCQVTYAAPSTAGEPPTITVKDNCGA
ncbi:MAG TPA: type II secretion system protein [Gammaproteobacteria bacterium]|nr:type II secretion system protein [Gammaproteobacteria bacterium]